MQTLYYANDVTTLLSKKVVSTKEQRAALLRKALILDNDGNYLPQFFSAQTIKRDKEHRAAK
jgi:hypothetical protein